jgi:hypothetical protein
MAHYALLDENNIVVEVITGVEEDSLDPDGNVVDWEEWYGNLKGLTCKRTSYNTNGNQHLLGGTPFRGNYAAIGYTYDPVNDVFFTPKPFDSWTLNTSTWFYDPPTPPVLTEEEKELGWTETWNEETQQWDTHSPS